jgi:hypothetical protein
MANDIESLLTTKDQRRLEYVVNGAKSSNRLHRMGSKFVAYYFGGVLPHHAQERFAESINSSPERLTTINALVFGIVGASLEYGALALLGNETKGFMPEKIAEIFNITYNTSLYTYAGFNLLQSFGRIAYAKATKKGVMSFSLFGIGANLGYAGVKKLKQKLF